MAKNTDVLKRIRGGLIVSCQALESEPLHSSYIMSRMAYAAQLGGASGIRSNSPEDIAEIKKTVDLPIIGLYKKVYEGSDVYITPTEAEVDAIIGQGLDIIAIDATDRYRPFGEALEDFFGRIRKKYPDMLFMADCSCFEDGVRAEKLGFDLAGTTLSGYTEATKGTPLPNFDLIEKLSRNLSIPVIAEGGIFSPEELKTALQRGAYAAVVGTAITRPMEITKRYVKAISE